MSLGLIVVEGPIKSGTSITARCALEQGREVFAVPGSILHHNSAGPHYLIQNGAKLVTDVNDVLDDLNLTMIPQQAEARSLIPDNETEASLLKQLSSEPVHIDDLGQATGLVASEIASTLTIMELKGMVRHVGNMNYVSMR
jgi:DNA processing protein